jgi:lysophospholipase L1-like esterase
MPSITRRSLIAAAAVPTAQRTSEIRWHNPADWAIEGQGWTDTERRYDRFPSRARGMVPEPVWNLSRHSAGLYVRFRTDSPSVHLRMDLMSANLAMPHMPATGVSGFDLYRRQGDRWQWLHQAMPTAQHVEAPLISGLAPGMFEYTGWLPLYNGVEKLEIGVEPGARFEPISKDTRPPIVFYGTSICHGACASRPGMAYTAILQRMLDQPIINLGFSGNGRMDPGVTALLTELNAAVYVIDCLPNMSAEQTAERTEPLVRTLRQARPKTPILLVEDRTFAQAPAVPGLMSGHRERRAALRSAFRRLRDAGAEELYLLSGDRLLGTDGEGTTDGSHPNDLGMMRYAEAYRAALKPLLTRG